ncbi:MAG TPA: ABC transporter permease [Pyrinomonadaceae bacterium]|nr:ABC transporter permease [Pyrinomonadaceae bacterium]
MNSGKADRSSAMRLLRFGAILIIGILAAAVLFADLISPYDPSSQSRQDPMAPPSEIRFRDIDGNFVRPFIYSRRLVDPIRSEYRETETEQHPISFFVEGEPYSFWGMFTSRTRLVGISGGTPDTRLYLLGTDQLGRDRFSRLIAATRFSLIVCPIGAALACLIGIIIGLVSGYGGRFIDTFLMGAADSMLALPTLILILATRAAFPLELPPFRAAVLLIGIFALTGWAAMARLTRSLVLTLKEREFVLAARASGVSEFRIIFRHVLPNAAPAIVSQALVMLPAFLLAEVALSFLGIGVQEPQPSLGNMLAAAGDITQLIHRPFLLLAPAIVIFLFVLSVRLLADAREADLHSAHVSRN